MKSSVEDDSDLEVGGFDLVKVLDGVDAGDFPGDTVFTVVASGEVDGEAIEEEFALPVDGSVVAGPQDLPVGTVVSFDEIDVPDLDGFTFTGAEFSSEIVGAPVWEAAAFRARIASVAA